MSKIKILVAYHKPAYLLKNDVFVPIHLGRALAKDAVADGQMESDDYQWMLDNMIGDDTGDNISKDNPYFNEMTAIYWAWKNYDKLGNPDYIGFCHYRRHFIFDDPKKYPSWANDIRKIEDDYLEKYKITQVADIPNYDYVTNCACAYPQTVYQQYQENHKTDDLDYVLGVVKEKYPHLSSIAESYMQDKNIYFCNMFVMKKEIFFDYCEYIFSILFDFFKTDYYIHRDPVSARMFVSERLTGIYIKYLQTKNLKHTEYPITFILNTDILGDVKPIAKDTPAIVCSIDNNYVPIFSVFLRSLLDHTSVTNKYDICVMNDGITFENKKKLLAMCPENVSLRFISVKPYLNTVDIEAFKLTHYYTVQTYYRFFIAQIFKDYNRVIYLDADTVLMHDIATLYNEDIGDNYVAAARDLYMPLWNYSEKDMAFYLKNILKLKNVDNYFQAGVMIFNIKKLKKISFFDLLMKKLATVENPTCVDQDILNAVCEGHVHFLDNRWNFDFNLVQFHKKKQTLFSKMSDTDKKIYRQIKNDPWLIHYAGPEKPWKLPGLSFAQNWWAYARRSPFYEEIIYKNVQSLPQKNDISFIKDCINHKKLKSKYIRYKLFSKLTWGKTRKHYKKKRKELKTYLKKIKKTLKG